MIEVEGFVVRVMLLFQAEKTLIHLSFVANLQSPVGSSITVLSQNYLYVAQRTIKKWHLPRSHYSNLTGLQASLY